MKRRKSRPRNRKGLGSFNKKRKRKELTNKTFRFRKAMQVIETFPGDIYTINNEKKLV